MIDYIIGVINHRRQMREQERINKIVQHEKRFKYLWYKWKTEKEAYRLKELQEEYFREKYEYTPDKIKRIKDQPELPLEDRL